MVKRANAMFFEGISLDECIRFCFSAELFKFIFFKTKADRNGEKTHKYMKIKNVIDGSR